MRGFVSHASATFAGNDAPHIGDVPQRAGVTRRRVAMSASREETIRVIRPNVPQPNARGNEATRDTQQYTRRPRRPPRCSARRRTRRNARAQRYGAAMSRAL